MIKRNLFLFIGWRVILFVIAFFAVYFIHLFAGSFPYYDKVLQPTHLPEWVWGFGNFDGVHYLRIAQNGYNAEFSQAFFPLSPLLIRYLNFIPKNPTLLTETFVDPSFFITGLFLANLFFLFALIIFYKLVRIDFNERISFVSVILLLSFPTSFYFGSIYTESLFFLLTLTAFYFTRKENFIVAGVFGCLASATRILGLFLLPVYLVEVYLKITKKEIKLNRDNITKIIIGTLLIPLGTLLYMLYLRLNFENPFYFLTSQPAFGAERSTSLILLPQVIYRYIKIFLTVPINSLPFFNAFLEFSFTIIPLAVLIIFYKKMRGSYFLFTLVCLIVPTLTGTLSSMPRYSLMAFLILPYLAKAIGKYYKLLAGFCITLGIILLSLFIRGYWVS